MPSRPASEPGVAAIGRGYRPTGRLEGGLPSAGGGPQEVSPATTAATPRKFSCHAEPPGLRAGRGCRARARGAAFGRCVRRSAQLAAWRAALRGRRRHLTDGLREHTAEARSGCRRPGGGKSLVAGARIRPTLLELSPTPVPRPTENPRYTSRTLQPNPNPVPERRPAKSERRKRAGRRHAQESGVLCLHHKTNHHARERNGKVPRRRACLRPAGPCAGRTDLTTP